MWEGHSVGRTLTPGLSPTLAALAALAVDYNSKTEEFTAKDAKSAKGKPKPALVEDHHPKLDSNVNMVAI